jgi:replicative DNA helicase
VEEMSFITIAEAYREESTVRNNIDKNKICTFGIKPLDDALVGMLKNDLIVIGGDAGCGKSELAISIAQHNARLGRKVMLYFLEGGHEEATARMKWRDMCQEYFKNYTSFNVPMDYRSWRMNLIEPEHLGFMVELESKVYNKYREMYADNLKLYEISGDFNMENFVSSQLDMANYTRFVEGIEGLKPWLNCDLIVIDHLQYFSLPNGEEEIASITAILREVKKLTQIHKVPVVLISHLRKKYRGRGIPDQDDFYGTSNIPKIASVAITLMQDRDGVDFNQGHYPTFIRVCKCRTGISPGLAIKATFSLHESKYLDHYSLHMIDNENIVSEKEIDIAHKPSWAS